MHRNCTRMRKKFGNVYRNLAHMCTCVLHEDKKNINQQCDI